MKALHVCFCYMMYPESQTTILSSGLRHYLLKGYTDTLPVIQSHVIRIFVSSNFYGNTSAFVYVCTGICNYRRTVCNYYS